MSNDPSKAPLDPPPLAASDSHCLLAVEGWLELGNPREAAAEWEKLTPAGRHHPAALERRWQILAHTQSWDEAVEVAGSLITALPDVAAGWLHRAYALRRSPQGGLGAAWDALYPAAQRFPKEEVVAYNLACYATQLGRADEGWEWFLRALQITADSKAIRRMGLEDVDLKPLWPRIRGLDPS